MSNSKCAKHNWTEKVYECCGQCGQRHNEEHCIVCDLARFSKPLPCEPPASCTDESLRRHHYVSYITQQFAYYPNPIDEEELRCMQKRLSILQGNMWLDAQTINSWNDFRKVEMRREYFGELNKFLTEESKAHTIYPAKKDLFKAFELCPLEKVKVVILGQDPYINAGEAMGMAFSVPDGVKVPPSLRNIFTEIKSDLKKPDHQFKNGDLTELAKQGVLLMNTFLTVRDGASGSHAKSGWETFTDNAIKLLNKQNRAIVYLLWGSHAHAKTNLITSKKSLVLRSVHPSPLSANKKPGFFGNHHFTTANEFLIRNNQEPINWLI